MSSIAVASPSKDPIELTSCNPTYKARAIGVTRKTGFQTVIESTAAPSVAKGSTLARYLGPMARLWDSSYRHTRQKDTRSKPSRTGNAKSEQAGNDRGAMKEFTARSFAQEYKVCESTARRHLEFLVKNGTATAVQKPFCMMSNGKMIELKRTVTTYRLK